MSDASLWPPMLWLLLVLPWLAVLWVVWLWRQDRRSDDGQAVWQATLQAQTERLERQFRDELARSSSATRQEITQALGQFQQTLSLDHGERARLQTEQIEHFRSQLSQGQQASAQQAQAAREAQDTALARAAESQAQALTRFGEMLAQQLQDLSQANERRLTEVRTTLEQSLATGQTKLDDKLALVQNGVEQRLQALQAGNEQKLEQMRVTVDEKLHATLEQRLGESFKQVAERLEQVHRGLGDMQTLARDVGTLNRVLTNVKTRGIVGEVQLAGLLEQVFTPDQYAANVETVPGSGARVEFAIKLPGQRGDGQPLWLPIDAKFPRDDYERLLEAQDRADPVAVDVAARAIETRLRLEAKSIRDKYIAAPHTTDFAILFVPTEGLYAEALRRPGLVESLHREYRISLAGPTTLLATLSSLQMGFRTLALEKRSAEVWEVLGAVKTEFGKFGAVLAKTKKKLDEASNSISDAETRTRVMVRSLKTVEELPEHQAQKLLPGLLAGDAGDDLTLTGASNAA